MGTSVIVAPTAGVETCAELLRAMTPELSLALARAVLGRVGSAWVGRTELTQPSVACTVLPPDSSRTPLAAPLPVPTGTSTNSSQTTQFLLTLDFVLPSVLGTEANEV